MFGSDVITPNPKDKVIRKENMFISDLTEDKSHKASKKELLRFKKWALKEIKEWTKFIQLIDNQLEKK